jgi:hypothetical protein
MKHQINNTLIIDGGEENMRNQAIDTLKTQLNLDTVENLLVHPHGLSFSNAWEPPFKIIKGVSKQFPELSFTLLSDAYALSYWVSEAVYQGGKGEEKTLTLIDGQNFERVFEKIHGRTYQHWRNEQTNTARTG